ncbi:uncharacterized protein LOC129760180 [Uranotaenia lowii]|uniref:uncharacterized protein LOC129760180 n=1 Tax=Uranotaenia lowii TaxID=190385 RepID=UPI00247A3E72|nr:uncharacterized protein LOC129760180 [Uranotaenia lowii]
MAEKKMKAKELKRKNILDSMQRIQDFLTNYDEERDMNEVAIRLARLDNLMETFEAIQGEYETYDDEPEFAVANAKVRARVEEQYFRVKGGLVSKVPPLPPISTNPLNQQGAPAIAHVTGVKLPTIELPKFDGDLNEWLTFRDSFSSLIHSSPEIPCIQKFQYLRSALRGDALKLIESLTITANNYAVAWEALLNRYSNTYLLKKKHLQALIVHSKVSGKSTAGLRAVVEDFQRHVKILNQLNEPTAHWGSLLVQLLCSRIDDYTLKEWEEFVSANHEPTYENLIEILTRKIRTLESLHISAEQSTSSSQTKHNLPVRQTKPQNPTSSKINSYTAVERYQPECLACRDYHPLVRCPVFEKMQLKDRLNLVNSKRICSNCFRGNHFARNCQSNFSCKHCQKRHHSLLHPGFDASVSNNNPNSSGLQTRTTQNPPKANESSTVAKNPEVISSNSAVESRGMNVFLSTVVVKVLDGYGNEHLVRALLDSGSQSSLMSDRLCQKLRLLRHRIDQPILGIGESPIRAVCSVTTEVRSRVDDFSIPLNCLVLKKLTADLPAVTITTANWQIPNDITLADPEYNISRKVDLIIGAEHFYAILQGGRLQIGPPSLTLVENEFENSKPTLSPNDQYCEDFFKETVSRDSTGRYSVKYPKKEGFELMIGESFSNAKARLISLERKLDKNPILKERYHTFMAEFIQLGHMREVPVDDPEPTVVCYLPHHAVLKESSTTTKVRSVYNASAKTSTGFSLNDSLRVGPVIQDELFDILLRFRKNLVVLLADIEKMYRQIVLHPDDRPLLRLLWRFSPNDPITKYEMTTVTYGLGPSSFLATRTLHQLADDESASFPLAAASVKRDFYMDDFVRSEETISTAIQLRKEMDELMSRGGFSLRKWCSNFPEVLEGVPPENLAHPSTENPEPGEVVKVLGISWEPEHDLFYFKFAPFSTDGKITKNRILSVIAQLYDPLGLIAPVVVRAKIFIQQLWLMSIEWNEEVPNEIRTRWEDFVKDLSSLAEFRIPRFAFDRGEVQLHCFTDASESAYGACIYARTEKANGEVKVVLLAAKSQVAPLQKRSIPRLELCAAQLGARLSTRVVDTLDLKSAPIYYWTDSMVVIYWLRAPSQTWKTFVANRVADIHILTKNSSWQHVPGVNNPADVVSRGLTVHQLLTCKLWTHGPDWLGRGEEYWPKLKIPRTTNIDGDTEHKTTTLLIQNPPPLNPLFTRSFSYNRLLRTTAYCLRVSRKARKELKESTLILTPTELESARDCLVKLVQAECYHTELSFLRKGKPVPKKSTLRLLNPFVDASGIIRVGGRLKLSMETFSTKHQILLPGFHRFTRMLLLSFHDKLVHGGIALTLGVVRNEYWPTNGRRAVRSVIRTCFRCTRANPKPLKQPIGQIPLARVTPSRPFASTGIDYCGPVFVKSPNRKSAPTKAYIALFVCFSTKAVHIELVGDLSTASFLSALQRFVARRGKPEYIYSDNATNFIGARNELHALYEMFSSPKETDRIATALATEGIQWKMIPPRAPNFGGLWEAAVKVAKKHLVRQLGSTSLLYEDLVTILSQIEGAMNSRPLAPLSEDPNDFEAITPSHFLIGSQPQALPHPDLKDVPENRLKNRYQVIQQKQQLFWYHWQTEYLKELQRQSTTNPQQVNLKIGQVMILQDDLLPPVRWPLVRIMELHPGADGVTRVVTIRTPTGAIFKRAVVKLCPLPTMDEEESSTAAPAPGEINVD